MKTKNKHSIYLFGLALLISISACKYEKIVPGSYPDQMIYMSNANLANNGPNANGIYAISAIDVPGQLVRYTVDDKNKKFNLLLGILRSGNGNSGDVDVNISASTDTVSKLIANGKLTSDTQILPASAFSLTSSKTIPDGQASVTLPLAIDLNYLLANPLKKFAIAVTISSAQRAVTPLLGTSIILLDTKIFYPAANFTYLADVGNTKKIDFNNTSGFSIIYNWDFGDGSAAATETSPSHIYAAAGTYTVKLTATGISGTAQQSSITKTITVL